MITAVSDRFGTGNTGDQQYGLLIKISPRSDSARSGSAALWLRALRLRPCFNLFKFDENENEVQITLDGNFVFVEVTSTIEVSVRGEVGKVVSLCVCVPLISVQSPALHTTAVHPSPDTAHTSTTHNTSLTYFWAVEFLIYTRITRLSSDLDYYC